MLKITTLKSKTVNKFGSGSIPIKAQLAADVVDLSNSRNRRRGAVIISPAKAAAAVPAPAVVYIGRKRDRERAERLLEKAEREKAEADAETNKLEEEVLRAKEKKKAFRKMTAESSVSVCAKGVNTNSATEFPIVLGMWGGGDKISTAITWGEKGYEVFDAIAKLNKNWKDADSDKDIYGRGSITIDSSM